MSTENGLQVYFVDASLPGYQGLMSGLGEGSKVFVIENTSDAFAQMDAALASLTDPVAALHVYSHGREGAIFLGGQWIDEKSLTNGKANTLSSIGNYLTKDGDILLYGCYTGAGVVGESFMAQLARLTRADVAASNNLTGLGGDWVLENRTGPIESGFTKPQDWLGQLLSGGDSRTGMGVIEGTFSHDSLTGFTTNDIFYGHGGEDTLIGLDGNDAYVINQSGTLTTNGTLIVEAANEGIDTVFSRVRDFDLSGGTINPNPASAVEYIVLEAQTGMVAQHAKGNAYNQTMLGNALSNNLVGGGGNNQLYGYDGDDFLDGGSGELTLSAASTARNSLYGGKGNDNYIVRSSSDVVTELRNEGTDHVFSYVNYTLGAEVENLTLLDTGSTVKSAVSAMGNALNNVLAGNKESNYLDGGAGNDTLSGSKSGETDTLVGGTGNDAYYVYSTRDTIVEAAGAAGGIADSVISTVDYDLRNALNVEQLFLVGDGSGATMRGTGNASNNYIKGDVGAASYLDGVSGNNTLEGGYGDDTFVVRSTLDNIRDAGGVNTVFSWQNINAQTDAKFTNAQLQNILLQGSANLNATARTTVATNLVGNAGNNSLVGGNLGDRLDDTGGGKDTLAGGAGNDTYVVTRLNTTVIEGVNAGIDNVIANVDYALGQNVENLYMVGSAGQRGTGNELANMIDASSVLGGAVLVGGKNNAGVDTLIGGTGNDFIQSYNTHDVIDGGAGSNTLYIYYNVTNGASMDKKGWEDYLLSQNATVKNIDEYVYVGAVTTGQNITGTTAKTNLVGTTFNDTLTAHTSTASTLDGGAGADIMKGSSAADVFYVDNAGDRVDGNNSENVRIDTIRSSININLNQTVTGGTAYSGIGTVELLGAGNLTATGNATASTTLIGGGGNNTLTGGTGNDVLDGTLGDNALNGGAGDDLYHVRSAGDKVTDTSGADSILTYGVNINLGTANHGTNQIEYVENRDSAKGIFITGGTTTAGAGKAEYLSGYNDTSAGGDSAVGGNDIIDGKGGADTIYGGGGDDVIYYYGSEATIDGGAGFDTLMVKHTVSGNVSIGTAKVTGFEAIQLETVAASVTRGANIDASSAASLAAGSMGLYGNTGANSITGSAHNDYIVGGGGADTIYAGAGDDFVQVAFNYNTVQFASISANGGAGDDTLSFGTGNDRIVFGANSITHYNHATATLAANTSKLIATNFEFYTGGAGNDTLDAKSFGGTSVVGNPSVKTGISMSGGEGNDLILGSHFGDYIVLDGGNDTVTLGDGTGKDTLKLTTAAAGGNIVVNTYSTQDDTIDDSALAGWTRSAVQSGANAVITYSMAGSASITVTLNNVNVSDVFERTIELKAGDTFNAAALNANVPWKITGAGNNSITGGDKADTIIGGTGNNSIMAGGGNDDISMSASVAANALLTIKGEAGDDSITVGDIGASATVNIDGGADDDFITVGDIGASATVNIDGNAGDNVITVGVINSTAKVSLTGGTGNDDMLFFVGGSAVSLSVNGNNVSLDGHASVTLKEFETYASGLGGAVTFTDATGVNVSVDSLGAVSQGGVEFIGFETLIGTAGNDTFNIASGLTADLNINGNAGNDSITFGDIGASATVNISGGAGNDKITIGDVSKDAKVTIDGGANSDSLYFSGGAVDMVVDSVGAATVGGMGGIPLTNDVIVNNVEYYEAKGTDQDLLAFTGGVVSGGSTLGANVSMSSGGVASLMDSAGTNVLATFKGFNEFVGSGYDDTFNFGAYDVDAGDVLHIAGKGGDDAITLGDISGEVRIDGGEGKDSITVGAISGGEVLIFGDNGDGEIVVGNISGDAKVEVHGGYDDDKITIGNISGTAIVSIKGIEGDDTITVGAISGGEVSIEGHEGNDVISVGAISGGEVSIDGGDGNDIITMGSVSGNAKVTIDGGDGVDKLVFTSAAAASISYNAGAQTVSVDSMGGVATDITVQRVEHFVGGAGNDTINLSNLNLNGGAGTLDGGGGDDVITFGNVAAHGGFAASQVIYGDAGNDTIRIGDIGTTGTDTARVTLDGGVGNDYISIGNVSGESEVSITGGDGVDTLHLGGASAVNVIFGVDGSAILYGESVVSNGFEYYVGTGEDDTFRIASGLNTTLNINGGGGNDTFTLQGKLDAGALTLDGGGGDDKLVFGESVKVNFGATGAIDGNVTMGGVAQDSLTIMGMEAYVGSAQADAFSVATGLTGSLNIDGGGDADTFTLGDIAATAKVTLDGGASDDIFTVGNISDSATVNIDGGLGNDKITIGDIAVGAKVTLDGGGGSDTLAFDDKSVVLNVNDSAGVALGGHADSNVSIKDFAYYQGEGELVFAGTAIGTKGVNVSMDAGGVADYMGTKFDGFTTFIGSDFGDTMDFGAYTATGGAAGLYIAGGEGNDSIIGTASGDNIVFDGGSDTITLGAGDDTLTMTSMAAGGNSSISGFNVKDQIDESDLENDGWVRTMTTVTAGTAVTWEKGNNSIDLFLGGVTDTATINFGISEEELAWGAEFSAASSGKPWLITGEGENTITGSAQNDTIIGGVDNNSIMAGAGDDSITFASLEVSLGANLATVFIDGGAANDIIRIGGISDSVSATILGDTGDDKFYLGDVDAGASVTINGGAGSDSLYFTGSDSVAMVVDATGATVGGNVIVDSMGYFDATGAGNGSLTFDSMGLNATVDATGFSDGSALYSGFESITALGTGDKLIFDSMGLNATVDATGFSDGSALYNGFESITANGLDDALVFDNMSVTATVGADGLDDGTALYNGFESITANGDDDKLTFADIAVGGVSVSLGATGAFEYEGTTFIGFESLIGSIGDDTIDASAYSVSGATFYYNTGKGADTVKGSNSMASYITLDSVVAGLEIAAGSGINFIDTLHFGGGDSIALEFASDGKIDSISVGGVDFNDSVTLIGFEAYVGTTLGDYIDAGSMEKNGIGADSLTFYYNTGGGADTVSVSDSVASYITLGEVVGDISIKAGNGSGRSGVDNDTLHFGGATAVAMSISANGEFAGVSVSGAAVNVDITGFEAYIGTSGADTFSVATTAGADTFVGASLYLDGGAGNDIITFGKVSANNLTGDSMTSIEVFGGDGADSITFGTITAGDSMTVNVNINGGAGNDIITIGKISQGGALTDSEANVTLTGGDGADLYVLDSTGMGATITGVANDGNDTVKLWGGVTEIGTNDSVALNEWAGLKFQGVYDDSDSLTALRVATDGTDDFLTFTGEVWGDDNLSFWNTDNTARLFGGDVDLNSVWELVANNKSDFAAWEGITFSNTGSHVGADYKAASAKTT